MAITTNKKTTAINIERRIEQALKKQAAELNNSFSGHVSDILEHYLANPGLLEAVQQRKRLLNKFSRELTDEELYELERGSEDDEISLG